MNTQRSAQLVEAGLWLQVSGDVEGAFRLFEQALKLDPTNLRARELLDARGSTPPSFNAPEDRQGIAFAPDATSAWDSQSNPGVHLSSARPGLGAVMDMLAPAAPPGVWGDATSPDAGTARDREEIQTLVRGARDLIELDDHTGAIDLILKAQALAPDDPEVQFLRDRSEQTLQTMFESKLGSMNARPKVILKQDEIIWLNLDHRAGFVLAQIDGSVTFDDLFEVCGMSRLDTARILAQLVDEGVIAL
jgi:tetratricopeptide (TPR) repeat protein